MCVFFLVGFRGGDSIRLERDSTTVVMSCFFFSLFLSSVRNRRDEEGEEGEGEGEKQQTSIKNIVQ